VAHALVLIDGFRIGFYSNERNEPPHVHVLKGNNEAKVWLSPTQLDYNYGYNTREMNKVLALVKKHESEFLEMWHEHLG
jgi:hypothetical protein